MRCPGVASATLTVVLLVASGCSSSDTRGSSASSTPGAIATVPSTRADTSTTTWATTGLPDEELIAIALGALEAEGTPVGDDREPLVRRGATEVEISFPTRADLPPVIGGEPHVHLEPSTGAVLRITHTR